jgi:DNA polymerase-4
MLAGADRLEAGPAWQLGVRCVVHMDLDCFYAAVEQLLEPTLVGKPVAVVMGLDAQGRGAVATASYAARAFGVRSAQSLAEARRLCPELIVLPVRRTLYSTYSEKVMQILRELSPRVEQISIDEAFVELGNPTAAWPALVAARAAILRDVGLSCSFGIAPNKLVAKIATGQGKPQGFTVVTPGTESSFLAPLPVDELWGVGPRTAGKLADLGITTLGALAAREPRDLAEIFGPRRSFELHQSALGLDDSPLVTDRQFKSVSAEQTFAQGESGARLLWTMFQEMAADLASRLESQRMVARTVGIKLRTEDWKLITRDRTLPDYTDDAGRIATVAGELMREHWRREPLRLLGLRLSSLSMRPEMTQQPMFHFASSTAVQSKTPRDRSE